MKIGSLFTGYGGLDQAAEAAFGATTTWVSDIDKGACKILAHRYPEVPNLGDITGIDWSTVEPVDIITGGSPCQDLSHAGRRAGMTEGTRSNLWVAMREAIAQIRPSYVIWENVRGAFSAAADSDLEPCAGCVGDASGTHLRALGRVLGDFSDLGYDTQWVGLRAADVGAPHGRFRVFVLAADREGREQREQAKRGIWAEPGRSSSPIADTDDIGFERAGVTWSRGDGSQDGDFKPVDPVLSYLDRLDRYDPDPVLRKRMDRLREERFALLPTPAVNDMGKAYTPEEWDAWTAKMKAAHGNGNGHGKSLEIEAARLLPTPRATDGTKGGPNQRGSSGDLMLPSAVHAQFGQYAEAIQRWESVIGREAPAPTEPTGKGGAHRLSARFCEWMMGLPGGWITDVPGITRNEALKAGGNGVVPQQAFAAITHMLAQEAAA